MPITKSRKPPFPAELALAAQEKKRQESFNRTKGNSFFSQKRRKKSSSSSSSDNDDNRVGEEFDEDDIPRISFIIKRSIGPFIKVSTCKLCLEVLPSAETNPPTEMAMNSTGTYGVIGDKAATQYDSSPPEKALKSNDYDDTEVPLQDGVRAKPKLDISAAMSSSTYNAPDSALVERKTPRRKPHHAQNTRFSPRLSALESGKRSESTQFARGAPRRRSASTIGSVSPLSPRSGANLSPRGKNRKQARRRSDQGRTSAEDVVALRRASKTKSPGGSKIRRTSRRPSYENQMSEEEEGNQSLIKKKIL